MAQRIKLLGRSATTINSGGEKVFADEVEHAIKRHDNVREVVVVGRPSARWGNEVVALIVAEDPMAFDRGDILATAATLLARYKLPKDVILVEQISRTPVGKVDYAWAKHIAANRGDGS